MNTDFPKTPEFSGGLYRPSRVEADIHDLEIEGTIPDSIKGTFYQVAPDPQYPPMLGTDIFFNGDGMVKAFKFENGKVSLRTRYVQTDRLLAQKKADRSLTGIYRNPYTNDPLAAENNTSANTTVLSYNGVLLAMKEDALPYTMDLETLETIEGAYDFDGQVKSETFTAHPRIDPKTGNMIAFSYEAKGDGSHDIAYFEFDDKGKLLHEIWFKGPYAAMIHDCAITENYIILPYINITVDMDRVRAGGQHFQWQPDLDHLFAVFPRKGKTEDVRWFRGPKDFFSGHVLNSYEKDNVLYVDICGTNGNVFYFFPEESGSIPSPDSLVSSLKRWTFDLNSDNDYIDPVPLNDYICEFPRCDDRYMGQEYDHGWMMALDPSLPYNDSIGPRYPFQFMNQLTHINLKENKSEFWFGGDSQSFQEPIFVPKSADAPEGDGYIIALMNNLDTETTDLVILDSLKLPEGPIAKVRIPFRLRMSLHGSWAPKTD